MKYIVEILMESDEEYSEEMVKEMVEENMLRYADDSPFDISIRRIYTLDKNEK